MKPSAQQLGQAARQALATQDWQRVWSCATEIARLSPNDAESAFLMGMVQKAQRQWAAAETSFRAALERGAERYDAGIELADLYVKLNRHRDAIELLEQNVGRLQDSPLYLHMAGQCYASMNRHDDAFQLFSRAVELQPEIDAFQSALARSAAYLGDVATAKRAYKRILARNPSNQRAHFDLSQLQRATDDRHIKRMERVLKKTAAEPAGNIYLYYALGKEYEDLARWDRAFSYFKQGGDAVKSIANYDVSEDVDLIDTIVTTCNEAWLIDSASTRIDSRTPVFVVGLPRTGTTLTERILSSHSKVQGAGESQLLQMVLRGGMAAGNQIGITPDLIRTAAERPSEDLADAFMQAIDYRLGDEPWFVEQLPENFLYLGFIAKMWPHARMVHLLRDPMDACFAMYKQSYFRFAYSLDDVAEYYAAYDKLRRHWETTLGDRMITIEYEALVSQPEARIRELLERVGLPFEPQCLDFDRNNAPVATASSSQVREKMHTRSIGRWKNYNKQLQPLRNALLERGIALDGGVR